MSADRNIYQRLHAAMGDVDYIQKERKQGMNYTIVSHDAVTAKVRPVLHRHGIVYHPQSLDYVQDGNRTQVNLVVRFVNVDKPDDFVDVPCLGFGIDSQDKGPGKAVSYAVKYALLKALGLETGDDPDEDAATPAYEPGKAPPARQQGQKQQPAGIDEVRQKAVAFKDDFIARVRKCGNLDDLRTLRANSDDAKKLQFLSDKHRDLFDDVTAAISKHETTILGRAAA